MHRSQLLFAAAVLFCLPENALAQSSPRIIHVFVALADNQHQGIIPVPAALGNGDDPARNLYWGAAFGVRTFFRKSPDWQEIAVIPSPTSAILERVVFRHRETGTLLVADAYRGSEIRQAMTDFFLAAAGLQPPEPLYTSALGKEKLQVPANASLVVYVGHDGLMDFPLPLDFAGRKQASREAIILACASKAYFSALLRSSGAQPLLWTTGLMAPEAYTLKAATDGWIAKETKEQIHERAAFAYAKYQKCGMSAAKRLFSTSW
jgi:hypothetical protein